MNKILCGAILILSSIAWSAPAVLFEEVEVQETPHKTQPQTRNRTDSDVISVPQKSTLRNVYQTEEYNTTFEMRSKRRVGVGAMTAGSIGLYGAMADFTFTPTDSGIMAFGGGTNFRSFNFQWRHLLMDTEFAPYAGVGYARWYNASGSENMDETTPSVLGSKFLTDDEKRTGKFGVDLITPTLGVQYHQLWGRYTGTGIFLELAFLTQLTKLTPIPTAALGLLYYF